MQSQEILPYVFGTPLAVRSSSAKRWRLVRLWLSITNGTGAAITPELQCIDGAGFNTGAWFPIATFPSPSSIVTTWSVGTTASDVVNVTLCAVPIPDDLWIEPNWLLQIAANAGVAITAGVVVWAESRGGQA